MEPQFLVNLGIVLVLIIVAGLGLRALAPRIFEHFGGAAHGWRRLSGIYGTTAPPPADILRAQSLMIDQVLYRRCMSVCIGPAGLYIEKGFPLSLLGRSALLIGWSEVKELAEARLFWQRAIRLAIGEPRVGSITLPMPLFAQCRPWLAEAGVACP